MHGIRSFGSIALEHDKPVIGDIHTDIIDAVVISYRRCPTKTTIRRFPAFHTVLRTKCDTVVGMSYNFPVDQVFGVANRNTRHGDKRRAHHIIIFSDPDYIGIGIVGLYDRIGISTVAVIGRQIGRTLQTRRARCYKHRQTTEKQKIE